MRRTQLIGVLLWRGGLLLAAGAAVFESVRWFLRLVDLPPQLEVGVGLVVSGAILVFVSLIIERIRDLRAQEDLRE
jgi:hypothetical protein